MVCNVGQRFVSWGKHEVTLELWGKGVLKLDIKYQLRELEILLPNEMLLLPLLLLVFIIPGSNNEGDKSNFGCSQHRCRGSA